MGVDLHTVSINPGGSSSNYSDRLVMGLFRDQAMPASGASVTSLGAITAGSGFTNISTLTVAPSGGTLTAGVTADPAVAAVTSLTCVTATVSAPGSGVAISDTFNATGGTIAAAGPYGIASTTAGIVTKLTATHIQVVNAVVNAGGSGGTPGAVTITGTTGTGTKWQGTATISAGGALTGPITITVAGDYTANPTIAGDAVTGGSLSGATVTLTMGAKTFSITNAGGYSATPPSPNTLTDVVGTGTGVTATLSYGVGTAIVLHSGNYSSAPSFAVTDSAGGTGASIATATLGGSGAAITRRVTGSFSPGGYTVQIEPSNQTCQSYIVEKDVTGFSVAFVGATTLASGTFDALALV